MLRILHTGKKHAVTRPLLLQLRSHETVLTTYYWDWECILSHSAMGKNHWQLIFWGGDDPLLSK